ncbi:MAG: malate synthase G, partial [Arcobacter sp.]
MHRIKQGNLKVEKIVFDLINNEILPKTEISQNEFWKSFENIIETLTPINKELLKTRDDLQKKIDNWYKTNKYDSTNLDKYKNFLKEIRYLVEQKEDFKIDTKNIDDEITLQAGPQLVVPVKNARFALNAANARWGSLYDALYGTDVISKEGDLAITKEYNKKRGEAVVTYAKEFLDESLALQKGSYKDVIEFKIVNNELIITLENGETTTLKDKEKFLGFI